MILERSSELLNKLVSALLLEEWGPSAKATVFWDRDFLRDQELVVFRLGKCGCLRQRIITIEARALMMESPSSLTRFMTALLEKEVEDLKWDFPPSLRPHDRTPPPPPIPNYGYGI